jgi:hypothetical protein
MNDQSDQYNACDNSDTLVGKRHFMHIYLVGGSVLYIRSFPMVCLLVNAICKPAFLSIFVINLVSLPV